MLITAVSCHLIHNAVPLVVRFTCACMHTPTLTYSHSCAHTRAHSSTHTCTRARIYTVHILVHRRIHIDSSEAWITLCQNTANHLRGPVLMLSSKMSKLLLCRYCNNTFRVCFFHLYPFPYLGYVHSSRHFSRSSTFYVSFHVNFLFWVSIDCIFPSHRWSPSPSLSCCLVVEYYLCRSKIAHSQLMFCPS